MEEIQIQTNGRVIALWGIIYILKSAADGILQYTIVLNKYHLLLQLPSLHVKK